MLSVLNFLKAQHIDFRLIQLPRAPQSAKDVAELFDCSLSHVIKTLVCVGDKNIIVCIQGDRQVSLDKLKNLYSIKKIRTATPKEIRELTGYEIGGVCPFCIPTDFEFVLDKNILMLDKVNIGAGTRTAGIELNPIDLQRIWPGKIDDISCH